jgi:fructokinase
LLKSIADYDPQWIYTGTLFHSMERNEVLLQSILEAAPSARVFYDMNLRPKQWDVALVERLCKISSILKLNEHEVDIVAAVQGIGRGPSLEHFAQQLWERFGITTICVTLGSRGCFVYDRGSSNHVPGLTVHPRDTVGAGDAFSAAFLHGYERNLRIADTARLANAVGALVASRSGATPFWTMDELRALSASSSR